MNTLCKNLIKINKTFPKNMLLKKDFFLFSNKQELEEIKNSLKMQEKSFFSNVLGKFADNLIFNQKPKIINHTSQELNPEKLDLAMDKSKDSSKLIVENLKKSKEEDMKSINEIFKFQIENLSKRKYSIESIQLLLEKIKQVGDFSLFINDKRFSLLINDLLFILNDASNAKVLFNLTFLSFLFNSYGNLKEYHEKLKNRLFNVIRVSEILDIILVLRYFHQVKLNEYVVQGSQHLITEASVRIDPNIHKRNKEILIENDEFINILLSLHEFNNLDGNFIEFLNQYIEDNLDSFSINELIQLSLFYVHYPNYQESFLKFFKATIYEKKLRRNIKNMSVDNIYNICYILHNFKMFELRKKYGTNEAEAEKNFGHFRMILETLVKNESLNSDLQEFHLIKNTKIDLIYDMSNLIVTIIENAGFDLKNIGKNLDKETKIMVELLFKIIFMYFLSHKSLLNFEQTFNFLSLLDKKKLIETKILNETYFGLCEKISSMDSKNLSKFLTFTFNNGNELKHVKKLKTNLHNLFLNTQDPIVFNEIILFFTRVNEKEFFTDTNIDMIYKKYEEILYDKIQSQKNSNESQNGQINSLRSIEIHIKSKIKMVWSESNLGEILIENLKNNLFHLTSLKIQEQEDIKKFLSNSEYFDLNTRLRDFIRRHFCTFRNMLNYLENSSNEEFYKLSIFELSLIFHSINNIGKFQRNIINLIEETVLKISTLTQINFNVTELTNFFIDSTLQSDIDVCVWNFLKKIESDVINNLKQFSQIEFLLIFYTYSEKKCMSEKLSQECINIILSSLDQYSLYQLDLISHSLDNLEFKNFEVTGMVNRMKIFLSKKIIEKSVEDIDTDLIRESINDIINEENANNMNKNNKDDKYKKLI